MRILGSDVDGRLADRTMERHSSDSIAGARGLSGALSIQLGHSQIWWLCFRVWFADLLIFVGCRALDQWSGGSEEEEEEEDLLLVRPLPTTPKC